MTDQTFKRATITELLDQSQKVLEDATANLSGVVESYTAAQKANRNVQTSDVVALARAQVELANAWSELAKKCWLAERNR